MLHRAKRFTLTLLLLFFISVCAFAEPASFAEQLKYRSYAETSLSQKLLLAQTTNNYQLLPGDSFSISFYSGKDLINASYSVDSEYKLSCGEFGTFEAKGKSFIELSREIQVAIEQSYSFSSPVITLSNCGMFYVKVLGMVDNAQPLRCWGGSRLEEVVNIANRYANTRDVIVTSQDGKIRHYDMYQGLVLGDESQNPNLRPGDTITLLRSQKLVQLSGHVYAGGTYQLLNNEGLDDLINKYAGGLLSTADSKEILVTRFVDGRSEDQVLSFGDKQNLLHQDIVTVKQKTSGAEYVIVEGAFGNTEFLTKKLYRIDATMKASSLILQIISQFDLRTDLENVYLIRGEQSIALNIASLVSANPQDDIALEPGDRIIIAQAKSFINVSGAVNVPGAYPYVPGKDATYYINLAGGYTQNAKQVGSFEVINEVGKKIKNNTIEEGYMVNVPSYDRSRLVETLAITASVVGLVSTISTIAFNIAQVVK